MRPSTCCPRFIMTCIVSVLFANVALATENGQLNYPIGSNTVLNGIIPERGNTQFYNYNLFYRADKSARSDSRIQSRCAGRCIAVGAYLGYFKRSI